MCETLYKPAYKLGVWISDKKSLKLNWCELNKTCADNGYSLIKLNIEKPLEEQGKVDVFLHKLTDIIAAADQQDSKACSIIKALEQYISNHPSITVIDPLENVRILLNRNNYYTILSAQESFKKFGIFTPTFAEFNTNCLEDKAKILKSRNVKFPVICKPTLAHGSKLAHEMILIFNERGLKVCKPPCIVQSFVNHNAVLHKIFVVGNRYNLCQRPSLKNFYPSDDFDPIFYTTGEVCKADSQSTLSILDPNDQSDIKLSLDEAKIKHIIKVLQKEIGLLLFGFDVVIDNVTGEHAVIDINVFPSYDNFPNFFEHLLDCIVERDVNNKLKLKNGCDDLISQDFLKSHKMNGFVNVAKSCNTSNISGMNVN